MEKEGQVNVFPLWNLTREVNTNAAYTEAMKAQVGRTETNDVENL